MKKFFVAIWNFIKSLFGCKCVCCENEVAIKNNEMKQPVKLNFNQLVSTDRQQMFLEHGKDYRWYETCMKLENFLDEENDGTLEEIVNVFQSVVERGAGFDTTVHKFQHFNDGTNLSDSISGFWVEDNPLNEEQIKFSYEQAFERLMQANIVKPHSRYVTLRKQVGPIDANPQYIFGNIKEQVYVDAVTGDVVGYNPAFGPNTKFGTPLGEWP